MISFKISTKKTSEMINITTDVQREVTRTGIQNGLVVVYVPHTTAGVTINEAADPSVVRDILMELSKIVPMDDAYSHSEGNSAAHIKATLMGSSVQIPDVFSKRNFGTRTAFYGLLSLLFNYRRIRNGSM